MAIAIPSGRATNYRERREWKDGKNTSQESKRFERKRRTSTLTSSVLLRGSTHDMPVERD